MEKVHSLIITTHDGETITLVQDGTHAQLLIDGALAITRLDEDRIASIKIEVLDSTDQATLRLIRALDATNHAPNTASEDRELIKATEAHPELDSLVSDSCYRVAITNFHNCKSGTPLAGLFASEIRCMVITKAHSRGLLTEQQYKKYMQRT